MEQEVQGVNDKGLKNRVPQDTKNLGAQGVGREARMMNID